MIESDLTHAQLDAIQDYILVRTRRHAFHKHVAIVLALIGGSSLIVHKILADSGILLPGWVLPVMIALVIVSALAGVGLYEVAFSRARRYLRVSGLPQELIRDFDRYPTRKLARQVSSHDTSN